MTIGSNLREYIRAGECIMDKLNDNGDAKNVCVRIIAFKEVILSLVQL